MTYLGVVGVQSQNGRIFYTRSIIAVIALGETVGAYNTYGGYIYVG